MSTRNPCSSRTERSDSPKSQIDLHRAASGDVGGGEREARIANAPNAICAVKLPGALPINLPVSSFH